MSRTAAIRRNIRTPRSTVAATPAPVLFRFPDLARPQGDSVADQSAPEVNTPATAPSAAISVAQQTTVQDPPAVVQPTSAVAANTPAAQLAHSPKPNTTTSSTPTSRTWWEHWSSGLVLMVLIMALITASVIAFNDRSSPLDESVADGATEELSIPSIANLELPGVSETSTLDESEKQADSKQLASNQTDTSGEEADTLAPAGSLDSLIPDELALAAPTLSNQSADATSSTSRQQATVALGKPLLDSEPAADQQQESLGFTLPAVQVSHPSGSRTGDSPSLYDGASSSNQPGGLGSDYAFEVVKTPLLPQQNLPQQNQPSQAAASGTQVASKPGDKPQDQTPSQPSANNLPSQLASTTGSTPVSNATMSRPADAPGVDSSPEYQPRQGATTPDKPGLTPTQTSTPEMDMDAIVRAWREYKTQQLSTQSEPANRYSQPTR